MFGLFSKKISLKVVCIENSDRSCTIPDGRIIPSFTSVTDIPDEVREIMDAYNFKTKQLELNTGQLIYVKNSPTMHVGFSLSKKARLNLIFDLNNIQNLEYILGIYFAQGFIFHDKDDFETGFHIRFTNENNEFTEKMDKHIPDILDKLIQLVTASNSPFKNRNTEQTEALKNQTNTKEELFTIYKKHWQSEKTVTEV